MEAADVGGRLGAGRVRQAQGGLLPVLMPVARRGSRMRVQCRGLPREVGIAQLVQFLGVVGAAGCEQCIKRGSASNIAQHKNNKDLN